MKQLPLEQAKLRGKFPNGEVITEFRPPFVGTTAQREQGKVYADTFAYLIIGRYKNGNLKLIKHPRIKGTKGK